MSPALRIRPRLATALALLPLLALTACGSGSDGSGGTAPAGARAAAAPTDDPVADVREVPSVAALLPAEVREVGTRGSAAPSGSRPAPTTRTAPKAPAGQDIDLADAVAKVLGVKL
ncbi:ABC transporter substrate-binding protein OS=Streptomyces fumanus OX=67302 GN=GCM10018772_28100 PE=4 SV=1 [Streptomyces fumanus]